MSPDGKLQVFSGDNKKMEEFDFLVWTGLLPDFLRKSNLVDIYGREKISILEELTIV